MKNIPTFENFLNESSVTYTIKEIDKDEFIVYAKMSSKIVGELRFIKSKFKSVLKGGTISVDPNYRRKGIASSMYVFAEEKLEMKFVKSDDVLTPDGKALWDSPNRKFGMK